MRSLRLFILYPCRQAASHTHPQGPRRRAGGDSRPALRHCCGTAVQGGRRGLSLGLSVNACSQVSTPASLKTPNALLPSAFPCLLTEYEPALSLGLFFTTSSKELIAAVEIYCVLALTQSQPRLGVYFSPLIHCTQQPEASEFRAHTPLCSERPCCRLPLA